MSEMAKLEPWQWPESHWRGLVNHVRAGRSFRPKAVYRDGRFGVANVRDRLAKLAGLKQTSLPQE